MREYLCIARKHSTSNHRHLRTQMKETQGPSCIDGDLRLRTIVAAGPNLATGICKAQLLRLNDDEDREYGQELCTVRSAQHDGVAGVGVWAERGGSRVFVAKGMPNGGCWAKRFPSPANQAMSSTHSSGAGKVFSSDAGHASKLTEHAARPCWFVLHSRLTTNCWK